MRSLSRFQSHLLAVLLALLVVGPVAARAQGEADDGMGESRRPPPSHLDPRRYLKLDWSGQPEPLIAPCDTEPCRRGSKVIGMQGDLRIDFAHEQLRQSIDFETSAELSIAGFVLPASAEKGQGKRAFEIPGFAVVGKAPTTPPLDFSRALGMVRQLGQGATLAFRFKTAEAKAHIEADKARLAAIEDLIAAQEEVIRVTEVALRRIYSAALSFQLTADHLKEEVDKIRAAEAFLTSQQRPAAAARTAKVETFFKAVELNRLAVATWLDNLLADANAQYLPILANVVDREASVIRAVAKGISDRYEEADADLSENGKEVLMEDILDKSDLLLKMQAAVYEKYRTLNDEATRDALDAWQVRGWIPRGFHPKTGVYSPLETDVMSIAEGRDAMPGTRPGLRSPFEVLAQCQAGPDEADESPYDPPDLESMAEKQADARLSSIETLLRDLTGNERYGRVSHKARTNFKAQILKTLEELEELKRSKALLTAKILQAAAAFDATQEAAARCLPEILWHKRGLEALLMWNFMNQLIDGIRPVTISIGELDLEPNDVVTIHVSLAPGVANQTALDFLAVPWGWNGTRPRVKDVVTFVSMDGSSGDGADALATKDSFAPTAAVSVLWNYYGTKSAEKSRMRTLAPGIGIGATFVDTDNDQSTIELGLGVTFSLFDDLIHFTWGQNLMQKGSGGRSYWGIGLSLTEVTGQFKKD